MDRDTFDGLARLLAASPSRRKALGTLLGAALAGAASADAAKKGRGQRRKGGKKGGAVGTVTAEAADCSSPGPSGNLNGCDFNDAAFAGIDLSSSSMKGTKFRRADLCGADLSSSNLRNAEFHNADLTLADLHSSACGGAKFNGATFCGTKTCTGTVRNDDCPAGFDPDDACCGDADCPAGQRCRDRQCACVPATCASLGRTCGTVPDGCGGTLSCGRCSGTTPSCNDGTCDTCTATCGAGCFRCYNLVDGNTQCVAAPVTQRCSSPCISDADCTNPDSPFCMHSLTTTAGNNTFTPAMICANPALVAICAGGSAC